MTIFQSILLGIVQGLTEFIPVSSSGHLVIVPHLLGWNLPPADAFVFDVLVQVATLVGVIAYFWKDLVGIIQSFLAGLLARRPFDKVEARLGWYLILATIPAGLLGLLAKDAIESAFSNPAFTGLAILVTAGLLILAERIGHRCRELETLTWKDALWVGVFQAVSVFPGISRSGSTITGGMARDLKRPAAARFSFLMSIPVMLAAGLLAGKDLLELPNLGEVLPVMIPGFLAAAVTGYLAIRWLIRYLSGHSLYPFAAYCILVGLITLVTYLL